MSSSSAAGDLQQIGSQPQSKPSSSNKCIPDVTRVLESQPIQKGGHYSLWRCRSWKLTDINTLARISAANDPLIPKSVKVARLFGMEAAADVRLPSRSKNMANTMLATDWQYQRGAARCSQVARRALRFDTRCSSLSLGVHSSSIGSSSSRNPFICISNPP